MSHCKHGISMREFCRKCDILENQSEQNSDFSDLLSAAVKASESIRTNKENTMTAKLIYYEGIFRALDFAMKSPENMKAQLEAMKGTKGR